MEDTEDVRFGPFLLDWRDERLWCGEHAVVLRPKSFAVLRYLLACPGRLVTKAEILEAVWPELAVSETVLTVCVGELRRALGDQAQTPQYIETVHRRGYRFIGLTRGAEPQRPAERPPSALPPGRMVGRATELRQLHDYWAQAQGGQRQVVFVTGEAGIGKTTLVDVFLEQVAATAQVWLARGECVEHYGPREAYLPVLAALGRLCRAPGGARLVDLLRQHAPTWLVQMPALLSGVELAAVQRRVAGATQERMLRELVEALEVITAERPLVLLLEDVHWSDYATVDLLAYLGRRREPARLLVVGTYRPVDVILHAHPLKAVKHDLAVHGQCTEVVLELLTEAEVAQYLGARLGSPAQPAAAVQSLARALYQRADGQPLFMVAVVDALVRQRLMGAGRWDLAATAVAREVPESLADLITQQFERLRPAEQRLLEAASVAGLAWSTAVVAAGVGEAVEAVEERCAALARRGQFLRASGVEAWPDGTVAARFAFLHALYPDVVYGRLPVRRCMQLHARIGRRVEAGYGAQADERAAELARHFDRGRDEARAVVYLRRAAAQALQRSAPQDAIGHLTRGLEILTRLPPGAERLQHELEMQTTLGPALIATHGFAAPEVAQSYARAYELVQQVGEAPQLVPVLWGLWTSAYGRAEFARAHNLAEHLLGMGQRGHDPTCLLAGHMAVGCTLLFQGDLLHARPHLEQAVACYDPQQQGSLAGVHAIDYGVGSHGLLGIALALLGYPDQGLQHSEAALRLAREAAHPFTLASALVYVCTLWHVRREVQCTLERAEALVALATAQGFTNRIAHGAMLRGWALAMQGARETGLAQVRQALMAYRATGTALAQSQFLGLLAEVCGQAGQVEEGLQVLHEALACVEHTGERFWEAELWRRQGELLQLGVWEAARRESPARHPEAEACFQQALEVARRQEAKAWELRAAMSLARLWQRQGKRDEARELLAPIYGWFTEGFATADLQETKALLDALGSSNRDGTSRL